MARTPLSVSGILPPVRKLASWRATRGLSGAWLSRPTAGACCLADPTWHRFSGTPSPAARCSDFKAIPGRSSALHFYQAAGVPSRVVKIRRSGSGTSKRVKTLHCFSGINGAVNWMAVSPDGRRLLSSCWWGRELRLWDLEAKKPISRIDFGGVPPHRGSFAPDGRHAVWGGSDGVVRMYRLTEFDPANRPSARRLSPRRSAHSCANYRLTRRLAEKSV